MFSTKAIHGTRISTIEFNIKYVSPKDPFPHYSEFWSVSVLGKSCQARFAAWNWLQKCLISVYANQGNWLLWPKLQATSLPSTTKAWSEGYIEGLSHKDCPPPKPENNDQKNF